MNRCTYTLQGNVNPDPQVEIPPNLPSQMINEFIAQEKERYVIFFIIVVIKSYLQKLAIIKFFSAELDYAFNT